MQKIIIIPENPTCLWNGKMSTLLLAKEGYQITGIDQSTGMLNQFTKKLKQEPPEVRQRIQIAQHSMSDFSLGSKFNTECLWSAKLALPSSLA